MSTHPGTQLFPIFLSALTGLESGARLQEDNGSQIHRVSHPGQLDAVHNYQA